MRGIRTLFSLKRVLPHAVVALVLATAFIIGFLTVSLAAGRNKSGVPTAQRQFWEDQVFSCKSGSDIYPSKKDNQYDPMRRYNPAIPKETWQEDYVSDKDCDDGDMTFFNGLLCAIGEDRGCKGVALAQSHDPKNGVGRWWRSKRLIGEPDVPKHASFSTDHGLGVFLYLIKTGNKAAFTEWMRWIAKNPRIYAPLPSFCTHKDCVFKAIDCPLLVTVASAFGSAFDALSVCDPLQYLKIPTSDQLLEQFTGAINHVLEIAGRYEHLHKQIVGQAEKALRLPRLEELLPSVNDLRNQFNKSIELFKKAREQLLARIMQRRLADVAQIIDLA